LRSSFSTTKTSLFEYRIHEVAKCDFTRKHIFSGQGGGRRKLPYAFTEQGIYMLATVLKGELATKQSIFIMRAFKEMRYFKR